MFERIERITDRTEEKENRILKACEKYDKHMTDEEFKKYADNFYMMLLNDTEND